MTLRVIAVAAFAAAALSACDRGADTAATAKPSPAAQSGQSPSGGGAVSGATGSGSGGQAPATGAGLSGGLGSGQGTAMGAGQANEAATTGSTNRTPKEAVGRR